MSEFAINLVKGIQMYANPQLYNELVNGETDSEDGYDSLEFPADELDQVNSWLELLDAKDTLGDSTTLPAREIWSDWE